MNREQVIALAREAGLEVYTIPSKEIDWTCLVDDLEVFAALVAKHEREECAKVCEELELKSADGEWGNYVAGWSDGTDDCAAAIRSRT